MLDEFVGMLRGDAELPQRALRKGACVVGIDGAGLATYCSGENVTVTGIGQDKPCFQCFPVSYQAVRNCRVHLRARPVELRYRQVRQSFQQCREPLNVDTGDRTTVVCGKGVSDSVDLGGHACLKKKKVHYSSMTQ